MVRAFLDAAEAGRDAAWTEFARRYRQLLADRFEVDRAPFDALAEAARQRDVFLGCSCPTARQPDVAALAV